MFLHEILFMCNSFLIFSGFLNLLQEEIKDLRSDRLIPPLRSQGAAPQWVLYSNLWRVLKQIALRSDRNAPKLISLNR